MHLGAARDLGARVEVISLADEHRGSLRRAVRTAQYGRDLLRILQMRHYDVVHAHQHHFSSFAVLAAKKASVPIRIVQSHTDTGPVDRRAALARRAYLLAAGVCIRRYSTGQLAANELAARSLFGRRWRAECRILYYGTDVRRFVESADQHEYRRALGLAPDAWVVGHAGRFVELKNHRFLLRIAAELALIEPRFHLLLVGDGPLHGEMINQANEYGLSERVTFLGSRRDVPELMVNAMDAYLMPSLYEGLPIAVVEAQAAGLPCLVSSSVSAETKAVPGLFRQLSLTASPSTWAAELHAFRPVVDRKVALEQVERGPFNIANSARALTSFYEEQRCHLGT